MKSLNAVFLALATIVVIGCSSKPTSKIQGKYVGASDPNISLNITADKISASGGPLTITADYIVKEVDGNKIIIEVSAPNTPRGTASIYIEGDTIKIRDNFAFGGDWKKR